MLHLKLTVLQDKCFPKKKTNVLHRNNTSKSLILTRAPPALQIFHHLTGGGEEKTVSYCRREKKTEKAC